MQKPAKIEFLDEFKFNDLGSQFELIERKSPVNLEVAKPVKGKSRKVQWHAVFPMEPIPPQNYLDKMASTAIAKDNCIKLEPGHEHVVDVAVCFRCTSQECLSKHDCFRKQAVHATLAHMNRAKW